MTIKPVHLTVGQLFGHSFIFRVPKYQRNYSWTIEEIDDFLKDLELCMKARGTQLPGSRGHKAGRHHFFGGLVSVSSPVVGSARQNVEVIDGQQRLATFVMLVNKLRMTMSALAVQVDSRQPGALDRFLRDKAAALRDKYERYQDTIDLEMVEIARLELSKPDKTFFAELLAGHNPVAERRSHELLKTAYERVGRFLDDLISTGAITEKAARLALVDQVVEQDWTVIHMAASTRSEAYMLYQD